MIELKSNSATIEIFLVNLRKTFLLPDVFVDINDVNKLGCLYLVIYPKINNLSSLIYKVIVNNLNKPGVRASRFDDGNI